MNQNEDRVLGWDDEIVNDGQATRTLLPDGDYDFEIVDLKRSRHVPKGGGKLPECPKAEVTVRCYPADGGDYANIPHNLFLHSRCEGMLCEFFRGIGQRKHGEPLRPDWSRVIGSRGRCKVKVRSYTNKEGETRETNDVKRFYDPTDDDSGTGGF